MFQLLYLIKQNGNQIVIASNCAGKREEVFDWPLNSLSGGWSCKGKKTSQGNARYGSSTH